MTNYYFGQASDSLTLTHYYIIFIMHRTQQLAY